MSNQFLDDNSFDPQEEISIPYTTTGKRFANYLIDTVFCYLSSYGVMIVVFIAFPQQIDEILNPSTVKGLSLLFSLVGFSAYYIIFEGLNKGRTIGKLITGTRAITTNHEIMSMSTVLKRTICRFMPFEAFSFLANGSGWHDSWTDTYVVDESEFRKAFRI